MRVKVYPGALAGTVEAVPSKSVAHRVLIASVLADTPTEIKLDTLSDDIEATVRCIAAMGSAVERTEYGLLVTPPAVFADAPLLRCGESGSTARFLLPVAGAVLHGARLTGEGRLPERPFSPILRAMAAHDCPVSADTLPLTVAGGMTAGVYRIPGDVSSQYISGLLFALPLLRGDSRIELTTPLQSAPYVGMTLDVLRAFGIDVTAVSGGYIIPGGQRYRSPGRFVVEGDWSNAAVWLCAGALGSGVGVHGVCADSLQGDRAVVDILQRFGARVSWDGDTVWVTRGDTLHGCTVDVTHVPDLVPVLSAVAAAADGTTVIEGAARLRIKESDRLAAVHEALGALGAHIEEKDDGLVIEGGAFVGGEAPSARDHRIVMMLALAATVCGASVIIQDAEAINKSYPGFFRDIERLGGRADVINDGQ